MRTERDLLEEYKHADMGRRLNLYLQFREYRDAFLLIDMEGNNLRKGETALFCGKQTPSARRRRIKPWRRYITHGFAWK
jgi:hypothetical protein